MSARRPSIRGFIFRAVLPTALFLLALSPAAAIERGAYSVEILVDGKPLQEYGARSTTYIEALEGREYSIRLRNRSDRRIAVALSVDGLNTIDAKATSARDASKWILEPWETITLDGWQTSSSKARRFFFTTEEQSYGAWLGKTRNLGIITAAVFREKHRRPAPIYRRPSWEKRQRSGEEDAREGAAPSAPAEAHPEVDRDARSKSAEAGSGRKVESEARLSDDLAATGIGRKVDHRVRRVRFETEDSPAAVMEVRYEYHEALVRLGVLPRGYAHHEDPLDRRERARGFDDTGFAPDPYRRDR